jgi:hypothetical protein
MIGMFICLKSLTHNRIVGIWYLNVSIEDGKETLLVPGVLVAVESKWMFYHQ